MNNEASLYSDRVVLGTHGDKLEIASATLTIKNGVIEHIETADPKSAITDKTQDFTGKLITPAFINAHTHLAMAAFRGLGGEKILRKNVIEDLYFKIETLLTKDDVRAFARIGAYESLFSGVGVVWDHYYHGSGVADALTDTGLSGVVAPTLQDLSGPGQSRTEDTFDDTLSIAKNQHYSDHAVFAAFGPHATDTVSDSLWKKVREAAQKESLPVHAHLAQSIEEYKRNKDQHGLSPVERMDALGILDTSISSVFAHCIYASKADLKYISPERQLLVHCPYSQLQFCFPASPTAWMNAGVTFALATDCGASNDSMNPQGELRWLAGQRASNITSSNEYEDFLNHGGLEKAESVQKKRNDQFKNHETMPSPDFLLSTLWSRPGRFTPKRPAGIIAKGAWAHVAVWDLKHPALWPSAYPLRGLAFGESSQALTSLMVNGQWIGKVGHLKGSIMESQNYKDAIKEANERFKSLSSQF